MSTTTNAAAAAGPSTSGSSAAKLQPGFDFTKRKRWADLLLSELVDNITFVLSPVGKILYCGNAVTELLGWRDSELIDVNFLELVDEGDKMRFRSAFNDSLLASVEFSILVRLRNSLSDMSQPYGSNAQPSGSALFEMKCYPHVTVEGEAHTRCLFAMVSPYPSRNTAMLDSILDLKAENERLQYMIAERRAELASKNPPTANTISATPTNSVYTTSTLQPTRHRVYSNAHGQRLNEDSYMAASSSYADNGFGGKGKTSMADLLYGSPIYGEESPTEEGSKKKKAKRHHDGQYVCMTCGRTNSPEWRKGPAGPKTLCNACGLRWAKTNKKVDDHNEGTSSDALASQ